MARLLELVGTHRVVVLSLRDCFLKTLLDADTTDFTEFHGKTVIKRLLSVVSVKLVLSRVEASVYKKEGNNDLRNILSGDHGTLLSCEVNLQVNTIEDRQGEVPDPYNRSRKKFLK